MLVFSHIGSKSLVDVIAILNDEEFSKVTPRAQYFLLQLQNRRNVSIGEMFPLVVFECPTTV